MKSFKSLLAASLALILVALAAAKDEPKPENLPAGMNMYVIEREMPGVGKLSADELKGAAQKSCTVLRNLGPDITWLHSYVTDDKLYCVYIAPDEAMVREHAKQGGFPANRVSQVRTMIEPVTAE